MNKRASGFRFLKSQAQPRPSRSNSVFSLDQYYLSYLTQHPEVHGDKIQLDHVSEKEEVDQSAEPAK